ncbi:sphingosine hydroxylase [Crepidotus variabilis]|uniref:Sphingosine hydroxylase n=1 Tax=Crepidotus variabilis TaxID=179855 RepID=A0A9P6E5P4_9AGAR|nr:sphingosine hydroxylase [Crepidotus variabilis]
MNSTVCPSIILDDPLCFSRPHYPFYHTSNPRLLNGIPDHLLTLASPVVAYWGLSFFFHCLDISTWKWLDKYRIHESEEVKSKNLVTKTQVIWAVLFQQAVQTALGLIVLEDESHNLVNHPRELRRLAVVLEPLLSRVLARDVASATLVEATEWAYWWGIPSLQFFAAMFIIDTWQYFLHRWMHVNKFLYKHFHSWHHRLYVPYAFGSLYNHPVEGFLLDTLGALLAETLTLMNTRQAMVLFSFSSLKTVDDHCGYNLPWDPLQMMSGNNADYHDIHHQVGGIKANFAQPFFIHWDTFLGTRMTRAELQNRKKKST